MNGQQIVPLIYFRGADLKERPAKKNTPTSNNRQAELKRLIYYNDTQTGMLLGIPRSARCVQRFDDSLNSAIHITYRISLRSSSMREPRDPLLKVVYIYRHKGPFHYIL